MDPDLQKLMVLLNIPQQYAVLFGVLFILVALWILVWKGLALWKAAKKNSTIWFVLLLVINTVGILEILYYFWFSEMPSRQVSVKKKKIKILK